MTAYEIEAELIAHFQTSVIPTIPVYYVNRGKFFDTSTKKNWIRFFVNFTDSRRDFFGGGSPYKTIGIINIAILTKIEVDPIIKEIEAKLYEVYRENYHNKTTFYTIRKQVLGLVDGWFQVSFNIEFENYSN